MPRYYGNSTKITLGYEGGKTVELTGDFEINEVSNTLFEKKEVKTMKEISVEVINEKWYQSAYENRGMIRLPYGLVFLVEERRDFFCADPRARIEAKLIDFGSPPEIEWSNYQLIIFVSGFDKPDYKHPLWNKSLDMGCVRRGKIEDGNARTVYLAISEQLGLGFCAGITVHDTCGSWSNYYPHDFEIDAAIAPIRLYPEFTEKFMYITPDDSSWGICGGIPVGKSPYMQAIRHLSIVDIPLGAHYSIGMPGKRLAYIWSYMGGGSKENDYAKK